MQRTSICAAHVRSEKRKRGRGSLAGDNVAIEKFRVAEKMVYVLRKVIAVFWMDS